MDTIGLLAAWVGVVSFFFVTAILVVSNQTISPLQRWWASTSPSRAKHRIATLKAELAQAEETTNVYLFEFISLWARLLLTAIAGIGVIITSILILDLGPALLAAVLPFNLDSKLITRGTGVFLFLSSYLFIFRLCYLATKIRNRITFHRPERARQEIQNLEKITL